MNAPPPGQDARPDGAHDSIVDSQARESRAITHIGHYTNPATGTISNDFSRSSTLGGPHELDRGSAIGYNRPSADESSQSSASSPRGPIAQRQSSGLIIRWLQVQILLGPPPPDSAKRPLWPSRARLRTSRHSSPASAVLLSAAFCLAFGYKGRTLSPL